MLRPRTRLLELRANANVWQLVRQIIVVHWSVLVTFKTL